MFSITNKSLDNNTSIYIGSPIVHHVLDSPSRLEIFQSLKFVDGLVKELEYHFDEEKVKLLSLDAFDTVLLRNNKHEMRRFMEMGAKFASVVAEATGKALTETDFFVARILATKLSYRLSTPVSGCQEGSLDEIHEGMLEILGLPPNLKNRTILAELDYESGELEVSPLVSPILSMANLRGVKIVLISDMYMGKKYIKDLLERKAPNTFKSVDVYSSGDLKISKRAGLLYKHVAKTHSFAPSECLHIGDNIHSDYVMAKRHGWKSMLIPITDREASLLDQDERDFKQELLARGIELGFLL